MKMDGIYSRKEFKNFRLKKKQCFAMIHLGARGVKRNNVSDLSDSYTGGNGVLQKKKKKRKKTGKRGKGVFFPLQPLKRHVRAPFPVATISACIRRSGIRIWRAGVEKIISLSRLFASHDSHLNLG